MITGFNTDVQHQGVTYHVQTEDKGLDSPLILSLVYVGGAIIASKRTPYEDLVSTGFDEQALTERLQRQHKLICAAIKAGRIADLKRMGGQNGGAAKPEPESLKKPEPEPAEDAAPAEVSKAEGAKHGGRRKKSEPPRPSEPAPPFETAPPAEAVALPAEAPTVNPAPPVEETPPVETAQPAEEPHHVVPAEPARTPEPPRTLRPEPPPVRPSVEAPREAPAAQSARKAEPEIIILTTLADEVNALGDFLYRPAPEPAAPPEPAPPVGAEPQQTEAEPIPVTPLVEAEVLEGPGDASDELYVQLLDDEGEFRAGQHATIKVYVGRGPYGRLPAADASVTVKVLGTSFRPIILTTATDDDGVAVVRVLLPRFNAGRAAIIVRSTDGEDVAELRRIIRQ